MKTISTLSTDDLEEVYKIELLCHAIPWSKKTLASNQGEHYLNLKIEINHQIVGFCICQNVADEANLFNIAIHPQFREQGLAKDLLNNLIERLLQITSPHVIKTLWLEVRESNYPAIELYNSVGFNEITVRKNYYPTVSGEQEDAIIMAYTLAL